MLVIIILILFNYVDSFKNMIYKFIYVINVGYFELNKYYLIYYKILYYYNYNKLELECSICWCECGMLGREKIDFFINFVMFWLFLIYDVWK